MAELARWLRAEAARRADRTDAAVRDLEWLIRHASDEAIRTEALARYRALGGSAALEPELPDGRLTWVFRRLVQDVAQGRWTTARERVAGSLGELVDCIEPDRPSEAGGPVAGAGLAVLLRPWTNARVKEISSTTTRGELLLEGPLGEARLGARRTTDGWVFDRLLGFRPSTPAEDDGAETGPMAANVPRGQVAVPVPVQVGLAPVGGVRADAGRGLAIATATIVVNTGAAPVEAELSAEERRKFEQWIADLGSNDPNVRARARAALRAAGASARTVLQEHRDHADVEVSSSVRELLLERP